MGGKGDPAHTHHLIPLWTRTLTWHISLYSTGGVAIIGGNGKIDIDNTFEARLGLLRESALPAMREALFGKNPNRKFFD